MVVKLKGLMHLSTHRQTGGIRLSYMLTSYMHAHEGSMLSMDRSKSTPACASTTTPSSQVT